MYSLISFNTCIEHKTITTIKIVNLCITAQNFLILLCNHFLLPLSHYALQFLEFHINGITQFVLFFYLAYFHQCNNFETHQNMLAHVSIVHSFYSLMWLDPSLLDHLSINGNVLYFQFGATTNKSIN